MSLVDWVITMLLAGFAGFFAGYLRKKGENLATHEDVNKLVEQVRAVTTATKEIEAKISTDVWDRQKRWEMRREVIFVAAKRMNELEKAATELSSAFKVTSTVRPSELFKLEATNKATARWFDAINSFDETGLLVSITCERETEMAFFNLSTFAKLMAKKLAEGALLDTEMITEFMGRIRAARGRMRAELGPVEDSQVRSVATTTGS